MDMDTPLDPRRAKKKGGGGLSVLTGNIAMLTVKIFINLFISTAGQIKRRIQTLKVVIYAPEYVPLPYIKRI